MKLFSDQKINEIYNTKVRLPESYFKKYELPPACPVRQWNYRWEGKDFPRVWCILDFKDWVNKYNIHTGNTLGYTYDDPELEFVNYKNKILVDYPKYDLHTLATHYKESFDFFIFNQTLEHLYNPFLAVQNIYNTIKPGGHVFTSVPTLNIPHLTPIHFNGFTPMGLAMLFLSAEFEILEIGQWGNYDYIQKLWASHWWPGYENLQKFYYVPNEERNVCQCWILAKKN